MKVVITGSSGMVGQGVLQECIESDAVKEILLVNRIPIKLSNPKIKEVLVENFFELDTAQTDL
jgi:saccharopine dehydrogenase-like NADP-dependent oxidoreductase|tara:strand:- start:84037 stop:84225 length:189 start_codon:yes stop_codon:yes gene_type:complete